MIYHLYCALVMAGYSACGLLLGSYMIHYAGARDIDLGFLFMIQPVTIFLRPLICAQADRYQSHKSLLSMFAIISALAYTPFILLPFLVENETIAGELSFRLRYWLLVVAHLIGSIGFCGVRSLGDALACNYAKRVDSDFARYRKYGSMSFGTCGYLLGYINQDWILPDFTPSWLVYCGCMLVLAFLVYLWPDEYFVMMGQSQDPAVKGAADQARPLPSNKETALMILDKFGKTLLCQTTTVDSKQVDNSKNFGGSERQQDGGGKVVGVVGGEFGERKTLGFKQQLSIFFLLLRRDFRILLFLLIIFYGGLVGYAGPNFVYTYLNKVCHERGTCNAAFLSGLTMISYCLVESVCYMLLDCFRGRLNRVLLLEITFLSLAVHYYFYGFLLDNLSPYFFLVESLHGVEYSISLSTSLEFGYVFANEVELLLPELIQKGIISKDDDSEYVKVSLMATMSGCYTLCYDGFGCILGSLLFGIVIGNYSFVAAWITIGTLATIGLVLVLVGYLGGKCFGIRPEICRIKERIALAAANSRSPAAIEVSA